MTWMKVANGRLESNIVQFFSETEQGNLRDRFGTGDGDVLIMIADTDRDLVNKVLSALRLHLAERLKLIPEDRYAPLWVTDFPLFELKEGKLGSQHHPFTMPDRIDFDPANKQECLALKSRAYDLVMNGEELGGGSIRIHRMDIQKKIFLALELTEEELEAKFGFFLRALEYGAPPHGGLALGLDRVIAMILKASSIREVIAFPKNRSAFCPLSQAPSFVESSQLKELGLGIPSAGSAPEGAPAGEVKAKTAASLSERVSPDQVKHIAKLARLKLSDSEVLLHQKDLNSILEYVETLRDLDAENIRPMSHVIPMKNVWREDKPTKVGKAEEILSNAPDREKGFFKVPKIIEG
jgi:aspartyl-tRNA synthetase